MHTIFLGSMQLIRGLVQRGLVFVVLDDLRIRSLQPRKSALDRAAWQTPHQPILARPRRRNLASSEHYLRCQEMYNETVLAGVQGRSSFEMTKTNVHLGELPATWLQGSGRAVSSAGG